LREGLAEWSTEIGGVVVGWFRPSRSSEVCGLVEKAAGFAIMPDSKKALNAAVGRQEATLLVSIE
jgi:hypothetical protein